ncbi:MAG: hypothetical protein PHH93_09610 [Prolixibacteraceae bacterium]|nr:hypothetical protein [Prolixibacteraceae bacterium]
MLSIDHQRIIKGITVFRDFQDISQYFYLPQDKVRIANDGKGIQFVAYIDGEVAEGTEPEFTDNMDRTGGFLTLEVELGPTDSELTQIREELESEAGGSVKLSQVPFKDGNVKLVMFGSTGGEQESAVNFHVAGSSKPALFGKQTAVFSIRLGGKEAQIMWNLLKKSTQTQVGVVYDLQFLGLMPAYNLEITVDFKATEEYWQHHIDADMNLETGSFKIVSNNDIDLIMRDLVNEGAIKVNQIDFTGSGEGNPLGADDPNGMKLVKELLSPTLFNATAIPREDYNVLTSTLPDDDDDNPADTDNPSPSSPNDSDDNNNNPGDGPATPSDNDGDPGTPPSGPDEPPRNPPENPEEPETPERPEEPGEPEQPENPEQPGEPEQPETPETPEQPENPEEPGEPGEPETPAEEETPERIGTKASINAGYSLKHRSISEKVKRTYTFNKTGAKTIDYHPSGALTTEGSQFNPDNQVMLVRLGEGPFKEIEIEIRSALNFEDYKIREAIVHISYGYRETKGDKSKRKHEVSVMVNSENPRKFINFFVDDFGTLDYDYYVEFIHEPGSIIGTHETKIRSRTFENTTVRDIAVNIDDHSPLIPVEIQPGHITFSDEGVQSVQVFVAPQKDANGRTIIFKQDETSMKKFLIYPTIEDRYVYYKKELFFFKEDSITEEYENLTDTQVIVNRPETRVLTIAPVLVNNNNLVSKAIVKVRYENAEGEELTRSILLTSENQDVMKEFSIIVEEEDPRIWSATTQFLLTNGDLIEGSEIEYHIEQPFISLESCGLKVLKVSPILGSDTFAGNIAAIQVQIFDTDTPETGQPVDTTILRSSKSEATIVLKGVLPSDPLSAVINIFRKDGTGEVLNMVIPGNTEELLLKIFNV